MVKEVDWFVKRNDWVNELGISSIKDFFGEYNGYVVVNRNNPYYGKPYEEIDIDIHGGWTFGQCGKDIEWPELADEYKNEDHWVYGFDTCHINDTSARWPKDKVLKTIAEAGGHMQIAEILQERNNNRNRK